MHCLQGYLDGVLCKVASFGGTGVHVFILCSGFGLYLSYLNKPLEYWEFLRKRFGKVYVPYAVVIGFYVLWYLAMSVEIEWNAVVSHLLLYKMFDNELDISICYPFWFISTIIQFYICFPLIIKLIPIGGYLLTLIISLLWATMVACLRYEEHRPWGNFFLQYLWEFALGMWLAERAKEVSGSEKKSWKGRIWYWGIGAVAGMGLSAAMAWNGGMLKLYNDIPSLVGYGSTLLLICNLNIRWINHFFEYTSKIGYEWYLIHSLTFIIVHHYLDEKLPTWVILVLCLVASYAGAYVMSSLVLGIRNRYSNYEYN